jgi:hypothetical protein
VKIATWEAALIDGLTFIARRAPVAKRETAAVWLAQRSLITDPLILGTPELGDCSTVRRCNIAAPMIVGCAVDHRCDHLSLNTSFCDGQHKVCRITTKRAAAHISASAAQTFPATRKVAQFPAETWNYVEEFRCLHYGSGQSQKPQLGLSLPGEAVRPLAAFPLVWNELMQISLSRIAWLPH